MTWKEQLEKSKYKSLVAALNEAQEASCCLKTSFNGSVCLTLLDSAVKLFLAECSHPQSNQ